MTSDRDLHLKINAETIYAIAHDEELSMAERIAQIVLILKIIEGDELPEVERKGE